MKINGKHYRTVWMEEPEVVMIDQLVLPHRFELVRMRNHQETAKAIENMVIRGAGAIGAAAGYGMAQVIIEAAKQESNRKEYIKEGYERLRKTRPTAQNLFYALDRVMKTVSDVNIINDVVVKNAVREAQSIADEDAEACRTIGEIGKTLIRPGMRIMTHCNAGWLAFTDWGTALSPIYAAHRDGIALTVYASETRPRCQGSLLTAWELMQENVNVQVIPDAASGFMMLKGEVDMVITGADRVAANGDTANKIGTYEKAVLAKENGIPFYIAAPLSTFDEKCPDGSYIPIEERFQDEVLYASGMMDNGELGRVRISSPNAKARNYAFDVTPGRYITGIITEKGIIKPSN